MSEIRTNLLKSERGDASPSAPFGLRVSGVTTTGTLNVTANATISGNLGVAGTITYEDVARVDATGISTFREGFGVGPLTGIALTAYKDGSIRTSGIVTAASFVGDGSSLSGITAGPTLANGANDRIVTATGANALTGETYLTFNGTGDLTVTGDENTAANLILVSDQSDNTADEWRLSSQVDNLFSIANDDSGSFVNKVEMHKAGNVTIKQGNLVMGTSGKGVDFSATGNPTNGTATSELLDYYEEGTWTPVINTASGSVGAYSYQIGKYTRVGNLVTCHFYVQAVKGTGDGNTKITGLPYTAMNMGSGGATGEQFVGQYLYYAPGALTGQGHGKDLVATLGAVQNNTTELKLYVLPDDNENLAPYQLDWGVCSNSLYLRLIHTFTYFHA